MANAKLKRLVLNRMVAFFIWTKNDRASSRCLSALSGWMEFLFSSKTFITPCVRFIL